MEKQRRRGCSRSRLAEYEATQRELDGEEFGVIELDVEPERAIVKSIVNTLAAGATAALR
jgi:hypothetical protein